MKIALLATGDELTQGDILNTNGQTMATKLTELGYAVGQHLVVADQEQDIIAAIHYLQQQHKVIIITGGLGPTSDDRTRFALAKALNLSLDFYPPTWERITHRLDGLGVAVHESNKQQALFPKQAKVFANDNGSADACMIKTSEHLFFMLPGPPKECLPIFANQVLAQIEQAAIESPYQHKKWRLFGVSEGEMAAQLDSLIAQYPVESGYRWDYPYLEFKLRADKQVDLTEVTSKLEPALAPHIICPAELTASEQLHQRILQLDSLMIIDDQATGGALQMALQDESTAGKVQFCNQYEAHQHYAKITGLQALWQQQPGVTKAIETQLKLEYQHDQQCQTWQWTIPYRNYRAVFYARERIAAQLLEVINKC